MLSEFFIKIPYLLYFIPLIASLLVNFIDDKRFLETFTYCILIVLSVLSFELVSNISDYSNILLINSSKHFEIIGCEFKISSYNSFTITALLFVNLIGFSNYIHEIILDQSLSVGYMKNFFSIFLIYIFSLVGISLTNNILHLYIFMEVQSFCIYILIMTYKKREFAILSYKYLSNNIFGSILNMLAIFCIIIYFNTSNMFSIKQQLMTVDIKDNLFIFLMFILLMGSIVIKFFTSSSSHYFDTDKNDISFLSISNIFVNNIIGIYLVYNITHFLFNDDAILGMYGIDKISLIISSCIVIYNSVKLFSATHVNTMFDVFTRINLMDFGFILFVTFLSNKITDNSKVLLIFMIDFVSVSMLIYFFSAYISARYGTNDMSVLSRNRLLSYCFMFIILFKLFLPLGTSLYINRFLYTHIMKSNIYLGVPFFISKISLLFLLYRIIVKDEQINYNDNGTLNKKYINTLLFSITIIFLFVLFFNILINMFGLSM